MEHFQRIFFQIDKRMLDRKSLSLVSFLSNQFSLPKYSSIDLLKQWLRADWVIIFWQPKEKRKQSRELFCLTKWERMTVHDDSFFFNLVFHFALRNMQIFTCRRCSTYCLLHFGDSEAVSVWFKRIWFVSLLVSLFFFCPQKVFQCDAFI